MYCLHGFYHRFLYVTLKTCGKPKTNLRKTSRIQIYNTSRNFSEKKSSLLWTNLKFKFFKEICSINAVTMLLGNVTF
jgi:hypothetical protein